MATPLPNLIGKGMEGLRQIYLWEWCVALISGPLILTRFDCAAIDSNVEKFGAQMTWVRSGKGGAAVTQ